MSLTNKFPFQVLLFLIFHLKATESHHIPTCWCIKFIFALTFYLLFCHLSPNTCRAWARAQMETHIQYRNSADGSMRFK